MENLKAMIKQMEANTNETLKVINSKQCEVAKLMYDIKNLSNASIAKAKVYEEMATVMMNMADDLRTQAEDVKDWAMYDLSLEDEDDEEDDEEYDDFFDDDEEDEYDTCSGCGGLVEYDQVIFDDNGNSFCCQECLEEYNVLKDIDDEKEKEPLLFD